MDGERAFLGRRQVCAFARATFELTGSSDLGVGISHLVETFSEFNMASSRAVMAFLIVLSAWTGLRRRPSCQKKLMC